MSQFVDRFGRLHRSLRISITDRCNIRCQYCMPAGSITFLPRAQLLTYEEIAKFVDVVSRHGITRIRLTGGEPLVRHEVSRLIKLIRENDRIESIAITTNAMLLAGQVESLKLAGLDQINISLDTLREETFQRLSRRQGLDQVLAGIEAALEYGYRPRLNAVLMKGINDADATALVEFAVSKGLVMRFIEYMPLDSDKSWDGSQMISGDKLRRILTARLGPMESVDRDDPARPSQEYEFVRGGGRVGFIDSVTAPFCGACDRLRLTAEGKLRNCLFGLEEWDVREALRADDEERVLKAVQACVAAKYAGHGIGDSDFAPPERAMYQIGG